MAMRRASADELGIFDARAGLSHSIRSTNLNNHYTFTGDVYDGTTRKIIQRSMIYQLAGGNWRLGPVETAPTPEEKRPGDLSSSPDVCITSRTGIACFPWRHSQGRSRHI